MEFVAGVAMGIEGWKCRVEDLRGVCARWIWNSAVPRVWFVIVKKTLFVFSKSACTTKQTRWYQ